MAGGLWLPSMSNGVSTSNLSGRTVWVDGEFVRYEDARIHVLSHATQRGTTVFDVVRIVPVNSVPHAIGLAEHVERFARSMELMGMESDRSVPELIEAAARTVVANPGASIVKIVATWSEVPLRTLPVSLVPKIWIAAAASGPNVDTPNASGVKLRTATAPKLPASILPPSLKVAASYAVGVRERMAAVAAGYDDVLFKTIDGGLAEATTQSLAVVKGQTIALPPLDVVLDSITRQMMIELAQHVGIDVEVRSISWSEVERADELYLSSANHCALPVRALDDRTYACPGPVTENVRDQAEQLLSGHHSISSRWLTALE